jgi:hypothetical protein
MRAACFAAALAVCASCTFPAENIAVDVGDRAPAHDTVLPPWLPRASRSSPVDVSPDDSTLVVANADVDSVTVFGASTMTTRGTVHFAAGSMPVSVVIHPDGDTAFVALRKAQRLVRVRGISGGKAITTDGEATSGSEPTGVALSRDGKVAVVANYGESSVSLIDTATMASVKLAVGPNPRAVAVLGDTAYVTLFFGEPLLEASDVGRVGRVVKVDLATRKVVGTVALAPLADTGYGVGCAPNQLFAIAIDEWVGKAYVTHVCAAPRGPVFKYTNLFAGLSVIDLATFSEDRSETGSVALSKPIHEQGPADASLLGVPIAIATEPNQRAAYVVSQAGDVVQRVQFGAPRAEVALGAADRFMQLPLALPPPPTGMDGGFADPYGPGSKNGDAPRGPDGIVVSHFGTRAWVSNGADRSVQLIDLTLQRVSLETFPSAMRPFQGSPDFRAWRGKALFFTGTGRWADRAVNSCGSCHPDGLTDDVTWSFGAGPRQSASLDGTFAKGDPADHRAQNWTANFDEIHDVETNTRGTAGGRGAITFFDGTPVPLNVGLPMDGGLFTRNDNLSGSARAVCDGFSRLPDWDEIEAYIQILPANRAPTSLEAMQVARGRAVFEAGGCASCHGGKKWTVSRVPYAPSPSKNGSLPGDDGNPAVATGLRTEARAGGTHPLNRDTMKVAVEWVDGGAVGPERITCVLRDVGTYAAGSAIEKKANGAVAQGALGFNPPPLFGLATSAPYFHHGAAKTLAEVFEPRFDAHTRAGNPAFAPDYEDVADLEAFLLSIDDSTPPFPIPAGMDICGGY